MEHKHDSPQKHTEPHPPRARTGKMLKHRKPLFGALVLLVITAGFFVYMWNQMSSQLAEQRQNTLEIAQRAEAQEPDKQREVAKPQRDAQPSKAAIVAEEQIEKKTAPDTQKAEKKVTQKQPTATAERSHDKSEDKRKQPADTDEKSDEKSGLLAGVVRAVNDGWRSFNLF